MRAIAEYFRNIESVIASQYSIATSSHKGDKGEDREEFFVKLLNNHLPRVATAYRGGEILDCWDRRSGQTDIVVYSSYSPLMGHNKKPLFLAQGTYAAIEVKSVLNLTSLARAFEWSRRIKKLKKFQLPKETTIVGAGDTVENICTGVFAYTSPLDKDKVLKEVFKFHKSGIPNTEMIDFICVNAKFCTYRHRTEGLSGFISKDGRTTLEQRRKQCIYETSPYSFGSMFSTILEYVSYIGPMRQMLSSYLYPSQRCDGKYSAK